jgi:hypothetical protein
MEIANEIYIGCTNEGVLPIDEIKDIFNARHRNFIVKGVVDGHWEGYTEDTLVVMVADYEPLIEDTLDELRLTLKLEHIAVAEISDLRFL